MPNDLCPRGLRRRFLLHTEPETGDAFLRTLKPARIKRGRLVGSEIARARGAWKVWTPRRTVAARLAREHGLELRLFSGEAELRVTDALAARLLPGLGAKARRARASAATTRRKSPPRTDSAQRRLARAAARRAAKAPPLVPAARPPRLPRLPAPSADPREARFSGSLVFA